MERRIASMFFCIVGFISFVSGYGWLTLILGFIAFGIAVGWI